jgi:hypothetical protein
MSCRAAKKQKNKKNKPVIIFLFVHHIYWIKGATTTYYTLKTNVNLRESSGIDHVADKIHFK